MNHMKSTKGNIMTKITAVLPDQETAELVTDRLTALRRDDLDWRLVEPQDDHERILPAIGWPLGDSATTAGRGVGAVPVVYDYPEDEALKDRGVDRDEAESYRVSVERGGIAIIIEAQSAYEDEVRRILEEADAQQIDVE
jgi:hypothetical protein